MERAGAGAGDPAAPAAGFSGRPHGAAGAAGAAAGAGADGGAPAGRCGGLELQAGWEARAEGAGAGEEKGKGEQVQVVIHLAGGEVAMGLQEARDAPEEVVAKQLNYGEVLAHFFSMPSFVRPPPEEDREAGDQRSLSRGVHEMQVLQLRRRIFPVVILVDTIYATICFVTFMKARELPTGMTGDLLGSIFKGATGAESSLPLNFGVQLAINFLGLGACKLGSTRGLGVFAGLQAALVFLGLFQVFFNLSPSILVNIILFVLSVQLRGSIMVVQLLYGASYSDTFSRVHASFTEAQHAVRAAGEVDAAAEANGGPPPPPPGGAEAEEGESSRRGGQLYANPIAARS